MHRSTNRDVYEAKLHNEAQGDPMKTLKLLQDSPYRKHRRRAAFVTAVAEVLDQRTKEAELAEAVQV